MKLQLTPDWLIGPRNAFKTALLYLAIIVVVLALGYMTLGSAAISPSDLDTVDNGTVEVDNSTDLVYADLTANASIEDHGAVDSANYTGTLNGTTLELSIAPNQMREYAIDLNSTSETIRVAGSKITDGDADGTYTLDLSGESDNVTADDSIDSIEAIAIGYVEIEDSTGTVVDSTTVDLVAGELANAEISTTDADGNRTIENGTYEVTVYGDTATIDSVTIGTTEESGGVTGAAKENAAAIGVVAILVIAAIAGVVVTRD